MVRFSVPHAGWAFIALAHREVRMLIIGVPAALIALFALLELVGAVRDPAAAALPGSRPVLLRPCDPGGSALLPSSGARLRSVVRIPSPLDLELPCPVRACTH